MVGKKKESSKTKNKNVFDKINANDAFAILETLANEDAKIAKRIKEIAMEYLRRVDIEDIASQIYFDLNNIEVEDVWDQSGSTRYGYVDPTDKAWEMFEEALEPFIEELKKYQDLSMPTESKNYCMGILKGIYRFEKESKSEYKDWAVDAPWEYFENVLDDWKKGCKNPKDVQEMEEFIKKNFPGW
ncbi:MAG: hypothetical protein QMC80_07010 [Thermoplasmatales archaeon]|nr:hypothetical protein [Thermoplasmatales archaeon]